MMEIQQRVPDERTIEIGELLSDFASKARVCGLGPFSDLVMEFCARMADVLLRDRESRAYPLLQALGFWMRRTELARLKDQFHALASPKTYLVPVGTVFHIPPANVDTVFMYSWLLSTLTGNRNIIRLSRQSSPLVEIILEIFRRLFAEERFAELKDSTCIITYGHEREITEAVSTVSNLRIVWGGDATVSAVRSVPLPVLAKEIAFPDRFSFAAIKSTFYLKADSDEKRALGEQFFNDSYLFDQMACSSPRLIAWCGGQEETREARDLFFGILQETIRSKGYRLDTGNVLSKMLFSFRSIIDNPISEYRRYGNELTVLELSKPGPLPRDHCGGGLFYEVRCEQLNELAEFVEPKDQTLSYCGFDGGELEAFVRAVNGRGLTSLVPIGQALTFNRFWDGYDLFRELTRVVYVGPSN